MAAAVESAAPVSVSVTGASVAYPGAPAPPGVAPDETDSNDKTTALIGE